MKIVFSEAAETDLEEIGDYIAQDNACRALTFVRELRVRAQDISSMPQAFPRVPRYEHLGIRRRQYGNYLIFCRVDEARISIIRILHGAPDYEAPLFAME
ncbi:MAG TPA: type II toxin-antitoxin system RelE/ParE family toxin [Candidatus Limnocylindria bacterium]|nr:type II toxin-antitoxin system RelE/ParE family toxin [Candidatus Limnocylindria bacterium]